MKKSVTPPRPRQPGVGHKLPWRSQTDPRAHKANWTPPGNVIETHEHPSLRVFDLQPSTLLSKTASQLTEETNDRKSAAVWKKQDSRTRAGAWIWNGVE